MVELLTFLGICVLGWLAVGVIINILDSLKKLPAILAKTESLKKRYWPLKYIFTSTFIWAFLLILIFFILRPI